MTIKDLFEKNKVTDEKLVKELIAESLKEVLPDKCKKAPVCVGLSKDFDTAFTDGYNSCREDMVYKSFIFLREIYNHL